MALLDTLLRSIQHKRFVVPPSSPPATVSPLARGSIVIVRAKFILCGFLVASCAIVHSVIGLPWSAVASAASPDSQGVDSPPQIANDPVPTFEADIQPLLTRYGCNAGACHGKSRGQNGFALSLLGFDCDFDHDSLVRQARGRRLSFASPESSLLLQKALALVPHGGGKRIELGSEPYELIRRWIQAGAPRTPDDAPTLQYVEVEPREALLPTNGSVPLRVIAVYSDGNHRDVTNASAFQSNHSAIASVNEWGEIHSGEIPGETAIMARYMNHIAVCSVTIPLPGDVPEEAYASLPNDHPVDRLVWTKLKRLGMLPSDPSNDATFHRRAYLRIIGRLPTPDETVAFLADSDPQKRSRLIDHLLQQPEYADFWANKWADLLRPNPYRAGIKAVWMLDAWLRDAFRANMPYDQFVRELVTATGSTWHNGATVIFRDRPSTVEIGSSVSQLFLGVRLECAKCHHHPFEVWSQDDFYGFAAFFARVGHHGGLSPPISGGEELIYNARSGTLKHGRTGEAVLPKPLNGDSITIPADQDPRERLVQWMTQPDNPYFAHVMVNRVWAELMGRGIVEPVDDFRATNPATNQPLLDYLADDFRKSNYDIKHLIRTIATSEVFGLSSQPNHRNASDNTNFSRYYRQRLRAECLLDAINDVLGTQESFPAMPGGSRATELWTHRSSSVFLDTFGRPDPNQDPPCERTSDSTTPQILHLMNSPEFHQKLTSDTARPARLAQSDLGGQEIIEQSYLLTLCRRPTERELKVALTQLPLNQLPLNPSPLIQLPSNSQATSPSSESPEATEGQSASKATVDIAERRRAIEDLFWVLMNSPEFLFID